MEMERRQFLRGLAVGTATLAMAGLKLQAADFTAKEKKNPLLRFGIIGTGNRSRPHILAINSLDQMEVVALCDINVASLERGIKYAGKKTATYTDYKELLANPDINAVMICTPNLLHEKMLIDSLQAGKHVVCEKPMAATWEQAKNMKKAEDAAKGQVVLYALQLHYSRRYEDVNKIIASGKIGKPQYLYLPEYRGDWNNNNVWMYTDPETGKTMNWRHSHKATGGTMNEKMCHYFDILDWMVGGAPLKIFCNGGINHYKDGRDTWDHGTINLVYPGDVKAVSTVCMYSAKELSLKITGEEGVLKMVDGEEDITIESTQKRNSCEKIKLTTEVRHGQKGMETAVIRMYEHFLDCVQNGKKPLTNSDLAMTASKIGWLGELSSSKGCEVSWADLA